jgi:hypothetical protein
MATGRPYNMIFIGIKLPKLGWNLLVYIREQSLATLKIYVADSSEILTISY